MPKKEPAAPITVAVAASEYDLKKQIPRPLSRLAIDPSSPDKVLDPVTAEFEPGVLGHDRLFLVIERQYPTDRDCLKRVTTHTKRSFLTAYATLLTVTRACQQVGMTMQQFELLCEKDAGFKATCDQIEKQVQRVIKDMLIEKATIGDASAQKQTIAAMKKDKERELDAFASRFPGMHDAVVPLSAEQLAAINQSAGEDYTPAEGVIPSDESIED